MASKVSLYIGPATAYKKFTFSDAAVWAAVREQIVVAMDAGSGLIQIDYKGERFVFVYSPHLMVSWVESGA
ncbi:hypothetical protein [Microbacterium hominis]|uniref:Uncharacterized protein n=1 Tax=Microbacterium hominis TaxID=162426 RepID=A0A7D4UFY6_9MICO|nr:hypothetical protein [Microbacterium hominis]QKJ18949.1 hypothetical protein HQM25_05850 [Microbacterium hominis]